MNFSNPLPKNLKQWRQIGMLSLKLSLSTTADDEVFGDKDRLTAGSE